jgi:aldehyde:ferredoxin oxidoreductase
MSSTFGYAGSVLKIDLASGSVSKLPTVDWAERFLGGRGLAARLHWDSVPPGVSAFSPENAMIFATGPLAGIPVIGGSRWVVCARSPATSPQHFGSANLGGNWGLSLKSAGYDALLVQGRTDRPVYLLIHDNGVDFKDASALRGRGAIETREALKARYGDSTSVAAIGPAGENLVTFATISADNDAAGSSGMGAVMGSKNLKAVAVTGRPGTKAPVARPEKLKEITTRFSGFGTEMMSVVGTMQFRITGPQTEKSPCHGCLGNCLRRSYRAANGQRGKFMCQPATFYRPMAEGFYGPGLDVPFHAARLCDDYGLDTMALSMIMLWLYRCQKAGILSDADTGIPTSSLGSLEFIEALVKKISFREGFGDVMANGLLEAAAQVGNGASEQIVRFLSKGGMPNITDPRLYVTTGMLHAMEPRPPQVQLREVSVAITRWIAWLKGTPDVNVSTDTLRRIARVFWGSEEAADFSTNEGKALAAAMIQDREYAKECLVLCSFLWPVLDIANSDDHAGDPTLESQVLTAVTGNDIDEQDLYRTGRRAFNLQRAIMIRDGHRGKEDDTIPDVWFSTPLKGDAVNPDCLVPGKEGQPISRRGAVVDRGEFQSIRDEYYRLRGWDAATGLQTRETLRGLDLDDIADDLEGRGLLSHRT